MVYSIKFLDHEVWEVMAKERKVKKVIEKPYCSGTMTRAGYWGFIRSALRQKSRWWKPIQDCKRSARRLNKSQNKRLKYEFLCSECGDWFPEKQVVVDHVKAAGSLNKPEDLPEFVTNLFCEVDNLIVMCKECHAPKTLADRARLKEERMKDNV